MPLADDNVICPVRRGHCARERQPETPETRVVWLITRRRLAAFAAVPRTSSERKRGPGGNGDAVGNLADDALRRACSLTATNEGRASGWLLTFGDRPSMRTPDDEVARGRWGRSLVRWAVPQRRSRPMALLYWSCCTARRLGPTPPAQGLPGLVVTTPARQTREGATLIPFARFSRLLKLAITLLLTGGSQAF
jgi:hypothetical protein